MVWGQGRRELGRASMNPRFQFEILTRLEWISQVTIPLLSHSSSDSAGIVLANNKLAHHSVDSAIIVLPDFLNERRVIRESTSWCLTLIKRRPWISWYCSKLVWIATVFISLILETVQEVYRLVSQLRCRGVELGGTNGRSWLWLVECRASCCLECVFGIRILIGLLA